MNFDLCYTCYLSREVIHLSDNPTHCFEAIGTEYQTESEATDSHSAGYSEWDENSDEEDSEEENDIKEENIKKEENTKEEENTK